MRRAHDAVHAGDDTQVWNVVFIATGKKPTKTNPKMRRTVFFTPRFPEVAPHDLADTYTWVRSIYVTPTGGLLAFGSGGKTRPRTWR
jgi:hypothetical protein